eukprot:Clim_evm31s119 gene=Clim_evmTU31s119
MGKKGFVCTWPVHVQDLDLEKPNICSVYSQRTSTKANIQKHVWLHVRGDSHEPWSAERKKLEQVNPYVFEVIDGSFELASNGLLHEGYARYFDGMLTNGVPLNINESVDNCVVVHKLKNNPDIRIHTTTDHHNFSQAQTVGSAGGWNSWGAHHGMATMSNPQLGYPQAYDGWQSHAQLGQSLHALGQSPNSAALSKPQNLGQSVPYQSSNYNWNTSAFDQSYFDSHRHSDGQLQGFGNTLDTQFSYIHQGTDHYQNNPKYQ